jgi:heptosyltransferase II
MINRYHLFLFYNFFSRALIRTISWSPFANNLLHTQSRNILIFRTCALGDFLLSVPTFTALRNRFPNARICIITTTSSHSIQRQKVSAYAGIDSLPWLKLILPSIIDEYIFVSSFDFISFFKIYRQSVRKFNPDLTIHVSEGSSSSLSLVKRIAFLRLLGVKGPILGLDRPRSFRFFRSTQFDAGIYRHRVLALLESLKDIPGIDKYLESPPIFPLMLSQSDHNYSFNFFSEHGLHGRTVVAVAPGSIQPHKRWPIQSYLYLCGKMIEEFDAYIVVVGTRDDFSLGQVLSNSFDSRVINCAGITSISESAALFLNVSFLVANDGGSVHLASAVNCPVVSIIPGIEYPGSIEPWNSPDLSVRHQTPCSPCYSFTNCPLGHNKCMTDISVVDVMDRCRAAMRFNLHRVE